MLGCFAGTASTWMPLHSVKYYLWGLLFLAAGSLDTMFINSNPLSLFTRRTLQGARSAESTASERLASGLRINRAGDDAAGLAISERMTTKVNGDTQAIRNVNDGISVLQTAEGSLSSASELLQRVRQLAVQSANGSNSSKDRLALQEEIGQLVAEFDRIGRDAEFNTLKLLDGSSLTRALQAGSMANQTIMTGIRSTRVADLYSYKLSSDVTSTSSMSAAQSASSDGASGQRNRLQTQNLAIYARGQTGTVVLQAGVSAKDVAQRINNSFSQPGLVAARAETYALMTLNGTNSAQLNFKINGSMIQANSSNTMTDLQGVITAINDASGKTGVVASVHTLAGGGQGVLLHAAQGEDIQLTEVAMAVGGAGPSAGSVGTVGVQGLYEINNGAFGSVGAAVALTAGATSTSNRNTTVGGRVLMVNESAFTITHSAAGSSGGLFNYPPATMVSCVKGSTLDQVDITTISGSNDALSVIDAILGRINSYRGTLGAMQNRLDMTRGSLANQVENTASARSRVRDADFALETSNLAKAQVLLQAGLAMTSQANARPKQALELLG